MMLKKEGHFSPFRLVVLVILSGLILSSCDKPKDEKVLFSESKKIKALDMTEAEIYDKVLGNLVGSAYGDAMGAPTEMWSRAEIKLHYGQVKALDSMIREASPEGPWLHNQEAGGTTDDTRWKNLVYGFLIKQNTENLDPRFLAKTIIENYEQSIKNFKSIDGTAPEPFEENMLKMGWLQEWAKVSRPYLNGDLDGYADALSKFYGGEMVCAGLLYAPAVGTFYPGNPTKAYDEMYKLSIFDIGYARDISALTAAITASATGKNANKNDLLKAAREIDPKNYFKSRLVGRTAFRILREAMWIDQESKKSENPQDKAFEMLDGHLQDMPFHAGEIYLQVLTAMIFSDFDYQKTMQFLVNYGRDNDTTAAIAGGILGSLHGFKKLPNDKNKVMAFCKNKLNFDLESLAAQLTKSIISRK